MPGSRLSFWLALLRLEQDGVDELPEGFPGGHVLWEIETIFLIVLCSQGGITATGHNFTDPISASEPGKENQKIQNESYHHAPPSLPDGDQAWPPTLSLSASAVGYLDGYRTVAAT